MRYVQLVNHLSPGDIVMLTAAVRDLKLALRERISIRVDTSAPALWENNPHTTTSARVDTDWECVPCEYPLVNRSNQLPYHFIHGFRKFLEDRLRVRIPCTAFHGDIHLSEAERCWMSQVEETAGLGARFWIVNAGGKRDYTAKWWPAASFQAVVDALSDRVLFVQVGAREHHHPALRDVIDLRGRTDLRQLVRLVHHADGVLCPVTLTMHLAAAVPKRHGRAGERPCVVVAGGREPPHWEAYPTHRYLHTVGALACCRSGGCWKSRTAPLGDGDPKDLPPHLCEDVVGGVQRCMAMITPDAVVSAVASYYEGGALGWPSSKAIAAWRARHLAAAPPDTPPPTPDAAAVPRGGRA